MLLADDTEGLTRKKSNQKGVPRDSATKVRTCWPSLSGAEGAQSCRLFCGNWEGGFVVIMVLSMEQAHRGSGFPASTPTTALVPYTPILGPVCTQ
jgi:hypothetical protein